MKKIKSIVIFTLLALVLTACGNSDSTETNSSGIKDTQNEGSITEAEEDKKDNEGEKFDGILTEDVLRNQKPSPASDFEWKEANGEITINKYIGDSDLVVVPDTIDGKIVRAIGANIFNQDEDIVGIMLPDSVEQIKKYSFFMCKSLQIVIGEGIKEVLYGGFYGCSELNTLIISKDLSVIEHGAFKGCSKLEKLYVSSDLEKISETSTGFTFLSCDNLTIYGEAGSFIEQYCKDNNIPFQAE